MFVSFNRCLSFFQDQVISFRGVDFLGLDYHVNASVAGSLSQYFNPLGFESFAGSVFVHTQNEDNSVDLIGVLHRNGQQFVLGEGTRITLICQV